MIRTKGYIVREINKLKKRRKKLKKENELAKAVNKDYFKKTIPIIEKEIEHINVKIEMLTWVANTSEKQLPKLKKKNKDKEND